MAGLRTFCAPGWEAEEAPLALLLALLLPVAVLSPAFLTGRSSQLHPEVMTMSRPNAVAIFRTATTKVEIEDVEFMVMGLILNNGLQIKVSKEGGWGVGLSTYRIIPLTTMIWPFY